MNHPLYIYLYLTPKEGCFRSFKKFASHFLIVVRERKRDLLLLRARERSIIFLRGAVEDCMYLCIFYHLNE
jgi:hypothetical protein